MPWMRKAPCRNASSVLKMALLISWEDGQARLPTGYHPPLIAPSMSVAPTLRKKTLNSGEPDSLSCSYLLAACAHRCTGGPRTQPYMHAVKARSHSLPSTSQTSLATRPCVVGAHRAVQREG